MRRDRISFRNAIAMLPRAAVIVAALAAPIAVVQNVQAGSESILEGTYEKSSGAGLVIMVSLQRNR